MKRNYQTPDLELSELETFCFMTSTNLSDLKDQNVEFEEL